MFCKPCGGIGVLSEKDNRTVFWQLLQKVTDTLDARIGLGAQVIEQADGMCNVSQGKLQVVLSLRTNRSANPMFGERQEKLSAFDAEAMVKFTPRQREISALESACAVIFLEFQQRTEAGIGVAQEARKQDLEDDIRVSHGAVGFNHRP